MLKEYLDSRANMVVAPEKQIGASLVRVDPKKHCETNPIPYIATHFGHKLHVDQNKKLVRYAATHVGAIDGFYRQCHLKQLVDIS